MVMLSEIQSTWTNRKWTIWQKNLHENDKICSFKEMNGRIKVSFFKKAFSNTTGSDKERKKSFLSKRNFVYLYSSMSILCFYITALLPEIKEKEANWKNTVQNQEKLHQILRKANQKINQFCSSSKGKEGITELPTKHTKCIKYNFSWPSLVVRTVFNFLSEEMTFLQLTNT